MAREAAADLRDQLTGQDLRFAPFRTLNDFILDANWKTPNFQDISKLNNRVVSNLIYYQTNYFVFGIALFLLVGLSYPVDFLFGLTVVAAILTSFVYLSASPSATTNVNLKKVQEIFRSAKDDRPILVIVAALGLAYLILSFLGKLFIFLLGIVLPIQAMLLHAMFRTRNLNNKLANQVEKVSLRSTPMGVFLNALGLKTNTFSQ